jgi:hypothetical protein
MEKKTLGSVFGDIVRGIVKAGNNCQTRPQNGGESKLGIKIPGL